MRIAWSIVACLLLAGVAWSQSGNPLDPPKGNPLDPPKGNPLDLPQPPGGAKLSDAEIARKLVGHWLMRNEEIEIRIVFRADGTAERSIRSSETSSSATVKWSMQDGKLKIVAPEETVLINVKFVDDDTVELTDDEGDGVRLVRQKP